MKPRHLAVVGMLALCLIYRFALADERQAIKQKPAHAKKPHMPHKASKLPAEAIARIAEWIDLGAPYDGPLVVAKIKKPSWTEKVVADDARRFWSFQPLSRTAPPKVKNETWCKTAID